jgi:hypothetical protein
LTGNLFLGKQAGLKRRQANTGAVTLIQRFGSAANLNIHLHCLVLDGVYRHSEGGADFHEVAAPTSEELQVLLAKIITRIMRLLTKQGILIEEQDRTYLAEADRESSLLPLQAASCSYRIALGPRAGQKVLSLQSVPSPDKPSSQDLCAKLHGFSPHAAVRWSADQRQQLEHLCRYITRPAIANERLKRNRAGDVVLQLKSAYKVGTTQPRPSQQHFSLKLPLSRWAVKRGLRFPMGQRWESRQECEILRAICRQKHAAGRPAPCRPDGFRSDAERFFPLMEEAK